MGVMTRKRDELFVITSDRNSSDLASKRAPRVSGTMQVWTGERWSAEPADAKTFQSLDAADEYIRVNYTLVMAGG